MNRTKNLDYIREAVEEAQKYVDIMKAIPIKEIKYDEDFYAAWPIVSSCYLDIVTLSSYTDRLSDEQLSERKMQVEKLVDVMQDAFYDSAVSVKHLHLTTLASAIREQRMSKIQRRQKTSMKNVASEISVLPRHYVNHSFPGGFDVQEAETRFNVARRRG